MRMAYLGVKAVHLFELRPMNFASGQQRGSAWGTLSPRSSTQWREVEMSERCWIDTRSGRSLASDSHRPIGTTVGRSNRFAIRIAPFHVMVHVMATEGAVHTDKDRAWHISTISSLVDPGGGLLLATPYQTIDQTDPASEAAATGWWTALTESGGEGAFVKPCCSSRPAHSAYWNRRSMPRAQVPAVYLRA
jgi:hypothetical protein